MLFGFGLVSHVDFVFFYFERLLKVFSVLFAVFPLIGDGFVRLDQSLFNLGLQSLDLLLFVVDLVVEFLDFMV